MLEIECVFVKGVGRCPWIEKISWALACHESLSYENVPPSEAPGTSDSSWTPFTGVISCVKLVAEAVWAFRNTNHIYPT